MSKKTIDAEQLAYQKIKRAIMLGKLLPGQQITEDWVSKNLEMSRTPVRAAFRQLQQEGIIKTSPRSGSIIHEPTNKEIEDVFKVRILLEGYAAKMSVDVITDSHIEKLEELSKQEIKAYEEKDFEKFLYINDAFHELPAIAIGNECLLQQISVLNNWSNCYLVLRDPFYTQTIETSKSIPEHQRIISGLKNRDRKEAEVAIREHLESILTLLGERESIFD